MSNDKPTFFDICLLQFPPPLYFLKIYVYPKMLKY